MLTLFDPKKPIDFVRWMPTATKLSLALPAIAVVALLTRGVNWGIDFAGGTEIQVKFDKAVTAAEIEQVLDGVGFKKKQVQQYGADENHEMLVRVERITSMTSEDGTRIRDLLGSNLAALSVAGATADDVRVDFQADEGDRITVTLPQPKVASAAPKRSDRGEMEVALAMRLGEGNMKRPLDDAALDAMGAEGFDPVALRALAVELGYDVSAAPRAAAVDTGNAAALEQALAAQAGALATLLDEKSGFKLRRTKRSGETEASFEDAIQQDEPYQGRVKYLVQFQGVSADIGKALEASFGALEIRRVDFVDAKVAEQLRSDGLLAVLIALLCILLYVSVRFNVYFAPGAIVALAHDSLIAMMVFPLFWLEFDLPSIAAILTVVGYSINDTIVIYDRIRERMPSEDRGPLSDDDVKAVVNRALNETFSRSINTTLTTLFAAVALVVFTQGAIQTFATVLTAGFLVGSYSSIFVASSLFLWLRRNYHDPDAAEKRRVAALSREEKARGVV